MSYSPPHLAGKELPRLCINQIQDYATTVSSAGTLVLTNLSAAQQYITGTTTHTVRLPVVSTLVLGQQYKIFNNSTGTVTVTSSGGNSVFSLLSGFWGYATCISLTGTTAASWNWDQVVGPAPVIMDDTAATTYPTAPQTQGVWYGSGTKALTADSTCVVIGNGARGQSSEDTAVGHNANAGFGGGGGTAIGTNCTAGNHATAIGYVSSAGNEGVAIGRQCSAGGNAQSIGYQSSAVADSDIAIGFQASCNAGFGVAIGRSASCAGGYVAIGNNSSASASGAFASGFLASASALNAIAIGAGANANQTSSVSLGPSASVVDASHAFGLGINASSVAVNSLGLTLNGSSRQVEAYSSLFASTATASGTTTLAVTSARTQTFTGSLNQTVRLPDVPTLVNGFNFTIINQSTGTLTINNSASTTVNGTQSLTVAPFTLTVVSTATFPSSGTISVVTTVSSPQSVTYTGKTATTFTGCVAGGSFTTNNGSSVTGNYFVLTIQSTNEALLSCIDTTGTSGTFGWATAVLSPSPVVLDINANPSFPITSGAIWYGQGTKANTSATSVGIGNSVLASGSRTVVIGNSASCNADDCVVIGRSSSTGGGSSVIVGEAATSGHTSVVVGSLASANAGGGGGIAIGREAVSNVTFGIAIGKQCSTNGVANSICLSARSFGGPLDAAHSFAVLVNDSSLNPGTFGVSLNNAAFQLPCYSSYFASTVTAATTTTLSSVSAKMQYFTGTNTQTVVLPVVTTLANGFEFKIVNMSTSAVTVQSSGGNTVGVLPGATSPVGNGGFFTCINTAGGTGTASWDFSFGRNVTSVATGTGLTGGPITSTGTISLANTAVTPGSYTSANITVDAQGRLTAASNGSVPVVLDAAASPTYPTSPQTQGVWYGQGTKANCQSSDSVVIGNGASGIVAGGATVVGNGASNGNASNATAIGLSARSDTSAFAGGHNSYTYQYGCAIGGDARSTNFFGIAIGTSTRSDVFGAIAIGAYANSNGVGNTICLNATGSNGPGTAADAAHALVLGINSASVTPTGLGVAINNSNKELAFTPAYLDTSAAGTLTLSNASARKQRLSGANAIVVELPDTSTMTLGDEFKIFSDNTNASGVVVKTFASTATVTTLAQANAGVNRGGWGYFVVVSTAGAHAASEWSYLAGATII